MCPKDKTGPHERARRLAENAALLPHPMAESSSGNGLADSTGHPGEPSPSDPVAPDIAPKTTSTRAGGVRMVRHHRGRSTISVGLLTRFPDLEPASFIVLSGAGSGDALTVTLSCELTRVQWESLERALTIVGSNALVDVSFAPTTENLVPLTT